MLNDSFSCRSTFFCILRDKNGYTIINGTGNYYIEAQNSYGYGYGKKYGYGKGYGYGYGYGYGFEAGDKKK